MPKQASLEPKTGIVKVKRPNGDIYVYERTTKYNPEKRFNETLQSKLIGKIPAGETDMVETRQRTAAGIHKKNAKSSSSSDLQKLLDFVLEKSGMAKLVHEYTDPETARQLLSLVCLELCHPGTSNDLQIINNDLLIKISENKHLLARIFCKDRSQAKTCALLIPISSFENRLVLCSKALPGPLVGLEKEKLEEPLFVLPSSYNTRSCLARLQKEKIPFLIPASTTTKWIRKELTKEYDRLALDAFRCGFDENLHAITLCTSHDFCKKKEDRKKSAKEPLYLHIFLDKTLQNKLALEMTKKEERISRQLSSKYPFLSREDQAWVKRFYTKKETKNGTVYQLCEDALEREKQAAGIFVLLTNQALTQQQVWQLFKASTKTQQALYFDEENDWALSSLLESIALIRFLALSCSACLQSLLDKGKGDPACPNEVQQWLQGCSADSLFAWFACKDENSSLRYVPFCNPFSGDVAARDAQVFSWLFSLSETE